MRRRIRTMRGMRIWSRYSCSISGMRRACCRWPRPGDLRLKHVDLNHDQCSTASAKADAYSVHATSVVSPKWLYIQNQAVFGHFAHKSPSHMSSYLADTTLTRLRLRPTKHEAFSSAMDE